ncbi:MAG TPA: D-aminoacylase [Terriglobia bacterium]|nr:D-aminoacylase [Terriglobia bacterium]
MYRNKPAFHIALPEYCEALFLLMIGALWSAAFCRPASKPQYDLLIIHGHIIDGSGSPWFEGSVAVRDGEIVAVGRLIHPTARRVIDATGLVVAPGFIDLHSHSDYTLLADGDGQSKIRQGVTTEIIGEDASAGPFAAPGQPDISKSPRPPGFERNWETLGQYFRMLQKHGIAVNIASYVGSGQVWMDVMGNVNRRPTPEEMQRMEALVSQGMQDGAIGLASGLIYAPNMFESTQDLIQLARVAAKYGGIYSTHIRGEGNNATQALREAILIGEEAGLPVHIFHFKMDGKENWGHMADLIQMIDQARQRGVDVTADQYPYIAGWTKLAQCLPPKFLEGSLKQRVKLLKDPKVREEIRRDIAQGVPGWTNNEVKSVGGWHGVMVSAVQKPQDKPYEGKRMDEVAQRMHTDPVDALCNLLIAEGGSAYAIYFSISEADMELAMKQPWVGIGSDGAAVNPDMQFVGKPHPRFYGTFPRVLGVYVRQKHVLTLPDAIRKMTSFPAQITGLIDRGLLRPGMAADITIFNPGTVVDRATFGNPLQYPEGIPYVIVNGTVVIDQGHHTGNKPGQVLFGRAKLASRGR